MTARAVGSVLILLMLIQPVVAQPLSVAGGGTMTAHVLVESRERTVTFSSTFRLETDAIAYVKVLPASENPVYLGGDEREGWYTAIRLDGEEFGGTNGTQPVNLGALVADTDYFLEMEVRIPQEAMQQVTSHKLKYALALEADSIDQETSGGTLDPSVSLLPTIHVTEDASQVQSQGIDSRWYWFGGIAAVAAALFLLARRRRTAPESESSEDGEALEEWAKHLTPEQREYLRKGGK